MKRNLPIRLRGKHEMGNQKVPEVKNGLYTHAQQSDFWLKKKKK